MPIEVRPATAADVPGIRRVARRAWEAAHEPIVGREVVERFLGRYYDAASVTERARSDADLLLVADADAPREGDGSAADPADGEVVGFTLARETDAGWALSWCYVDPDRWGEGVGGRLLDAVEGRVAARGGERLELAVMAANDRAVGFYEAAGYERVERFHDDDIGADSYRYAKSLDGG